MRVDRERAGVEAFYVLLGASLIAFVVADLRADVWGVHTGRLFPWRHVWPFPLWSTRPLLVEWALLVATGLALIAGVHRIAAARVALVVTAASLTQSFSNARSLAFLVLLFVSLGRADSRSAAFVPREQPNLALVRAQLVVVYLFSAANKLLSGFASGEALSHLLHCPLGAARALSLATLLAEVALHALLIVRPWWGMAGVAILHVAFAALVPGLWPFTLLMMAMSALFAGDGGNPIAILWRRRPG